MSVPLTEFRVGVRVMVGVGVRVMVRPDAANQGKELEAG